MIIPHFVNCIQKLGSFTCSHELLIILVWNNQIIQMPRVNTSLKEKDFQDGKLIRTDIDGKSIVIGMTGGKLYAMDSVCSHEGGPLEDGTLESYDLICPWHQGIFDVRSAKASPDTSWVTDLNSYKVTIDDKSQEIYIDTD